MPDLSFGFGVGSDGGGCFGCFLGCTGDELGGVDLSEFVGCGRFDVGHDGCVEAVVGVELGGGVAVEEPAVVDEVE